MTRRQLICRQTKCAIVLLSVLGFAASAHGAEEARPALVVIVSVDQWAYQYLDRFHAGFRSDGMVRRCQAQGACFTNCRHQHAFTYTGPGHGVIITGAYPRLHGVVDNEWYDRSFGKVVQCMYDPAARLIGTTVDDNPVSPRALLVDTLGDRLKLCSGGKSKVFSVAIKDRAALILAGRAADAAYWMSSDGKWVTCDYYRSDLPGYLRELNESGAVVKYAGATWDLLLAASDYVHGSAEDSFGERPVAGMKADFPHNLPSANDANYVKQLAGSPYGNEVTLEAARQVLMSEHLGLDDSADLLGINLSSTDYCGHAFGPDSLEVEDMTYRTDAALGEFCRFVDEQLAGRHWVVVITADHGVAPIPERVARLKIAAGRNPLGATEAATGNIEPARAELEVYVRRRLMLDDNAPRVIEALTRGQVYVRRDHPGLSGERAALAQRLVRDWLLEQETVAAAMMREELLSDAASDKLGLSFQRSFHALRSGDVLFVLAPYYLQGEAAAGHGSPWDYDTHVPLMLLSFGNVPTAKAVRHGRFERQVSPASIAPTLAKLLGVESPAACMEPLLLEALPE